MASCPKDFYSNFKKEPDFFKCQKSGKEILLFGTIHSLPLSLVPSEYLEIMKTAETIFLESVPKDPKLKIASAKEQEDDLIAKGFISEKPQGYDFDTQLAELEPEALKILKLLFKEESTTPNAMEIPFNRLKLDRLFWLCYFRLQDGGMESGLRQLFASDKILGLDVQSLVYPLPPVPIAKLNEFLRRNFICVNDSLQFSAEHLESKKDILEGFDLPTNFEYSNQAENDKVMLEVRNRAWLKTLASHLETQNKGPILVAVGHMHLVGRQGLLCLLQNEGYTISQYKPRFKRESTGFVSFEPNLLFNHHAEQFIVKSIYNEIDAQLQKALGILGSDKYKMNEIVQEYVCSWPFLIFSDIYPDKKTVADSTMILRNAAAGVNKASNAANAANPANVTNVAIKFSTQNVMSDLAPVEAVSVASPASNSAKP